MSSEVTHYRQVLADDGKRWVDEIGIWNAADIDEAGRISSRNHARCLRPFSLHRIIEVKTKVSVEFKPEFER